MIICDCEYNLVLKILGILILWMIFCNILFYLIFIIVIDIFRVLFLFILYEIFFLFLGVGLSSDVFFFG